MKSLLKFFFKTFVKKVLIGLCTSGGRNFLGRICVYHKGGGNKRRFKLVDRFRRLNQFGSIFKVLKDSNKTAFLGMILYNNGLVSFIILCDGLFIGSKIFSGDVLDLKMKEFYTTGSAFLLNDMSLFSIVSSIELFPFSGFKLARSAGAFAYIVGKELDKIIIKLNSGWQVKIFKNSMATLGASSNPFYIFKSISKAGKSRALGIRPTVRGVIKNPCDHPHGGGEGRGSPPVAPVSPWGKFTKGTPSKNRKIDRLKRRLFKSI